MEDAFENMVGQEENSEGKGEKKVTYQHFLFFQQFYRPLIEDKTDV